jgi:hypothetical protein
MEINLEDLVDGMSVEQLKEEAKGIAIRIASNDLGGSELMRMFQKFLNYERFDEFMLAYWEARG